MKIKTIMELIAAYIQPGKFTKAPDKFRDFRQPVITEIKAGKTLERSKFFRDLLYPQV
jgi:hypothetical protein